MPISTGHAEPSRTLAETGRPHHLIQAIGADMVDEDAQVRKATQRREGGGLRITKRHLRVRNVRATAASYAAAVRSAASVLAVAAATFSRASGRDPGQPRLGHDLPGELAVAAQIDRGPAIPGACHRLVEAGSANSCGAGS